MMAACDSHEVRITEKSELDKLVAKATKGMTEVGF